MYVAEFQLPDFASFDLTSLRTGMMSGAPCPVELIPGVLEEMHCGELVIAYGQTETSPVVTMSDAEDTIEVRVKTVGRAMPQTEIRIASLENGETLPANQQGEVCVRGYALMKGYDGDPEDTARGYQGRRLAAHRRPRRHARRRVHPHHRPLADLGAESGR